MQNPVPVPMPCPCHLAEDIVIPQGSRATGTVPSPSVSGNQRPPRWSSLIFVGRRVKEGVEVDIFFIHRRDISQRSSCDVPRPRHNLPHRLDKLYIHVVSRETLSRVGIE